MKTIYFLDWLSKETQFSVHMIVEAMKPENQGWTSDDFIYTSPYKLIENSSMKELVENIFNWDFNYLFKIVKIFF